MTLLSVHFEYLGVHALFAGGLVGAAPFHTLHIDYRHLLGFEHNVIERGRRRHHFLVVQTDGDVAPGALHEVFFEEFDARVLDFLRDDF